MQQTDMITPQIYGLEDDDDRPMRTHNNNDNNDHENSNDDNVLSNNSNKFYRHNKLRRIPSAPDIQTPPRGIQQQQGVHHSHIPANTLHIHTRLVRSFDALDNNYDPTDKIIDIRSSKTCDDNILLLDLELQHSSIFKQRSFQSDGGEVLVPAPESTEFDDSFIRDEDYHDDKKHQDEIENSIRSMNIHRPQSLRNSSLQHSSLSTTPRSSRLSGLTRQATQKLVTGFHTLSHQVGTRHLDTNKTSLTQQRYNRKSSSFMEVINEAWKTSPASEDAVHRLKSAACCVVFGGGCAALLYYLLKP